MTYKVLKFAFFILLMLPIIVIGFYFFVRLWKNKVAITKTDKKIAAELKKAARAEEHEYKKKQNFFDDYDKNKGYK